MPRGILPERYVWPSAGAYLAGWLDRPQSMGPGRDEDDFDHLNLQGRAFSA